MRWFWIALAVVGILVVVVLLIGWSLPQKHRASRQASFAAPPAAVWALITDVDAFPSWRNDVKAVRRLPEREGRQVWVEEGSNGPITLAVERSEAPRLLVLRIADPDLPFGGAWTYDVQPTATGSTLTITEDGEIYNPVFRTMARFVFGYDATMAAYLKAAEARLARTR
jgi:uncharacterized protein YndB with AHSA1/START domain